VLQDRLHFAFQPSAVREESFTLSAENLLPLSVKSLRVVSNFVTRLTHLKYSPTRLVALTDMHHVIGFHVTVCFVEIAPFRAPYLGSELSNRVMKIEAESTKVYMKNVKLIAREGEPAAVRVFYLLTDGFQSPS
jgi:hypothetical protein